MEVTRTVKGDVVELAVEGRLDGYWADHFDDVPSPARASIFATNFRIFAVASGEQVAAEPGGRLA